VREARFGTLTRLAAGFGRWESPYPEPLHPRWTRLRDSPLTAALSALTPKSGRHRWFPRFPWRKFSDSEWKHIDGTNRIIRRAQLPVKQCQKRRWRIFAQDEWDGTLTTFANLIMLFQPH